jgi:TonB family protein
MPPRTRLPLCLLVPALVLAAPRALAQQPAPPVPAVPVAIVPPQPLTPLHADYPAGAKGDAEVVLAIVIDRTGAVGSVRVVNGDEPFGAAAVAAAPGWRFEPATRDGVPFAVTRKVLIRFTAPPPEPPPPPVGQTPEAPAPGSTGAPAAPKAPKAMEVTVHGEVPSPGVQSLTRAEVRLLPGAFGDPFRAIDALPGVTPLVSGLPFFYVRGAPPGNVGYFLDGIRVPLLFHIGLGPSVIHPSIMDRVDLYSGGYPARYGRYAGGIVAGETRDPEPGWHGEANIRIVDAGAMAAGPLPDDRGDVFVAGRYSYTGLLLSLISSQVSLAYWDYQTRITFRVTPRAALTVFAFGAHDFLGNKGPLCDVTKDMTDVGGTCGKPPSPLPPRLLVGGPIVTSTLFDTTFHRLDLRYDHRFGGPEDRVRQAVTLGYDLTTFSGGGYAADKSISSRTEITKRVTPEVLLRAGLDAQIDAYEADLGPSFPHQDELAFVKFFPSHTDIATGIRADAVIAVTRDLEVTPGIRLDLFSSHVLGANGVASTATAVDPRLAARLVVTKDVRLVTAHGLASQPPSFLVAGPGFTPPLGSGLQRAFQSSLGVEADLPWDVNATVTVFRNEFFDMTDALGTSPPPGGAGSFPSNFDQRVNGWAMGLEVLLKRRLTRRLGGLVSYTLSRSERFLPTGPAPSSFDRTHVLNVAGSYDFGRGFKGGTRIVFYTGYPVDAADPSKGRIPAFGRLDARVEKRWSVVSGRGWVSLVIEALNAMGAKETLTEQCAQMVNCPAVQIGPVTIPSIGLEGGF